MRILDVESDRPVRQAQLYFTKREARQLVADLQELLVDVEAREHHHIVSDGCEISYSIVTDAKLDEGYTLREQELLKRNR